MNLMRRPDLARQLAAAHALGTLRGGARRRFETMARKSPALRALALEWQEQFAAMTELQASAGPSPNVWKRIELQLQRERESASRTAQAAAGKRSAPADRRDGGWLGALALWRGAAIGAGLASLAAIATSAWLLQALEQKDDLLAQARGERLAVAQQNAQLVSQINTMPQVRYVAVLEDDRSAPSILVTFDPRNSTLTLKRLGEFQEGPDRSLQLWALPPGGSPKSLGVLGEGAVVKLTAAEGQVRELPTLAISLEPRGGVPSERGPTGPVLFKGALLPTS